MADNSLSIHQRLLFSLLGIIVIVWVLLVLLISRDANHELEEIYDASLAQNARILQGLLVHEIEEGDQEVMKRITLNDQYQHHYELKIAFIAQMEQRVIQSRDAPVFPADIPEGFVNLTLNNQQWRVFSLRDPRTGLVVRTAQNLEVRTELVHHLRRNSVVFFLLALPILALLIWWGIGKGLAPLGQLAHKVEALSSKALKPIELTQVPVEVAPLIRALNNLLERLSDALENERRFTADAAHELRTPLAALKVQLQVAQGAMEEEQRQQALQKCLSGINRATHMVTQLLHMARADRDKLSAANRKPVDLCLLTREICEVIGYLAEQKQTELVFECESRPHMMQGDPSMLQVAIRNIVDNAIRYCPPQSTIRIRLDESDNQLILHIVDNGPGIPPEQVDNLFKRFKRGSLNSSGSGLGLSIVQRICQLHGAEIKMAQASPDAGGLHVTLTFDR